MRMFELYQKRLAYHMKSYRIYFLVHLFAIALFFCFACLFTNQEFMDGRTVDSLVSSNILFPSVLTAVFLAFFVPCSHAAFLLGQKREYGVMLCFGMRKAEAVKNLMAEGALVSLAALCAGLAAGTVASVFFYGIVVYGIGVKGLSFQVPAAAYGITALFYAAVSSASILVQGVALYIRRVGRLLKEPYQYERKGRIFCILWKLCPRWMQRHWIGNSFLLRHKKDWAVRYVVSALILAAIIFLSSLSVCIHRSLSYDALHYAPYDVAYVELFGMNGIGQEEVFRLAAGHGVSVLEWKQVAFARDGAFNYFPVSEVNQKLLRSEGTSGRADVSGSYRVAQGEFLNVFPYDLQDGYEHDTAPVTQCRLGNGEDGIELVSAGSRVAILFNQNQAFAGRILILNDKDYAALVRMDGYSVGTLHILQLDDWKQSAGFVDALEEMLRRENNISMEEQRGYYGVSSKIGSKEQARVSGNFLLFLMAFTLALLCLAEWLAVHFRIQAEQEEAGRSVHSLRLVGAAKREILGILQWKDKMRFLPQIVVAFVLAEPLIWYTMRGIYHFEVIGCAIGAVVAALLFGAHFFLAQEYAKREPCYKQE